MSENHNAMLGGSNWGFLVSSLHWLREEPAPIFIPALAPPASMPLAMTQGQANLIAALSVIVLPLTFALAGFITWLRRRNA